MILLSSMISLIRTVLTVKMTEKITLKKIFINFALSLFFYRFLLSRLTLLQSDLHIKKNIIQVTGDEFQL